jgi:hypothetical protein
MTATMPRRRPRRSPHNIFTGRRTGALPLRPKLARDGADGVIDRSQDARHSERPSGLPQRSPSCLELASRNPSWQRSCATATTDRTYDRKRSGRALLNLLQAGGRPHMGRGLNGRYPPSPVPVQGCTSHPGHNAGRHDAQAARERTANPPAGTDLAPMTRCASASCPSSERGLCGNCNRDECQ